MVAAIVLAIAVGAIVTILVIGGGSDDDTSASAGDGSSAEIVDDANEAGVSDADQGSTDDTDTDESGTDDPAEPAESDPPVSSESTTTVPADLAPSVQLVQDWATALADGQWSVARAIDPSKSGMTDEGLAEAYNGLAEAEIVYLSGDSTGLRVASVAHEQLDDGTERTSVYCYQVDAGASTISITDVGKTAPAATGWVTPSEVAAAVDDCR